MRPRLLPAAGIAAAGLAAAAIAVPAGPAGAAGAAAACGYRLDTRLPLPAGMTTATVAATGGGSTFAGTAANPAVDGVPHAVRWRDGQVTLLPTPAGAGSFATGANSAGDVVGGITPGGGPAVPVLWRGGRLIELANGGPDDNTVARDINDAGMIVGDANMAPGGNVGLAWSADTPDRVDTIRTPPGGSIGYVSGVNEAGVIAAHLFDPATPATAVIGVGTLGAGLHPVPGPADTAGDLAPFSIAGDHIAGQYVTADGADLTGHALRWSHETPTPLSKNSSVAWSVNSAGTVAGDDNTDAGARPVVWTADGTEVPLPVITAGPAVTAADARVITEDGTVAGTVTDAQGDHPVLWHCR